MAISLVAVGAKITAALTNLIITAVNAQGLTSIIPTSVAGSGVALGSAGKVTFTAAATVSLNGCFTSTYDAYRLVISVTTHSVGAFTQARLRLAGTDAIGASDYVSTTPTASPTGTAASVWNPGNYGSALADFIVLELDGPALARATRFSSIYTSVGAATARSVGQIGGDHILANAYDGITILAGSGTITGTLRVYGYNNN